MQGRQQAAPGLLGGFPDNLLPAIRPGGLAHAAFSQDRYESGYADLRTFLQDVIKLLALEQRLVKRNLHSRFTPGGPLLNHPAYNYFLLALSPDFLYFNFI